MWAQGDPVRADLSMPLVTWPQGHNFTVFPEVLLTELDLPGGSDGKESAYSAGEVGLIPGSG